MSSRIRIISGKGDPTANPPTGADDHDLQSFANDFVDEGGVLKPEDGMLEITELDTPGMGVKVAGGVVYVENSSWTSLSFEPKFYIVDHDDEVEVNISSNPSGSTRIDLICQKIDKVTTPDDTASNVCPIVVVEGTPGAGAPATPADHELLYEVEVVDGATSILNADLTDHRRKVSLDLGSSAGSTAWNAHTVTWTRTGNTTFTLSGDYTSIFTKGARLKWEESGVVKYGTVKGSSHAGGTTTVTMFATSDYVMAANPDASSTYYSYHANPPGYPTMFTGALTVTGSGGSAGTYAETLHISKFSVIGNQVFVHVTKNITNLGSWSGSVQLALPARPSSEYTSTVASFVNCYLTANGAVPGAGSLACLGLEDDNDFGTFVKQINTAALTFADIATSCVIHGDFSYYY